jgi:hypothetical protein
VLDIEPSIAEGIAALQDVGDRRMHVLGNALPPERLVGEGAAVEGVQCLATADLSIEILQRVPLEIAVDVDDPGISEEGERTSGAGVGDGCPVRRLEVVDRLECLGGEVVP